jgi:hypothetical protein
MSKRRFFGGTVALLVVVAVWLTQPADAIIVVDGKGVDTGMFGLTATQTARLHVVNASGFAADDPVCVVELRFLDAFGTVLGREQKKIMPGHADSADYGDPTLRVGERKHVRATVRQMLPGDFDQPAPTCIVTAEVFDNRTGQAGIIIINSHPVR